LCSLLSELSFKKGDRFLVKRRINDDWLEGEHEGSIGIFPYNHVELIPMEKIDGEGIAKCDFLPQKSCELQLRKVNCSSRTVKLNTDIFVVVRQGRESDVATSSK
jgi:hypothetical protein